MMHYLYENIHHQTINPPNWMVTKKDRRFQFEVSELLYSAKMKLAMKLRTSSQVAKSFWLSWTLGVTTPNQSVQRVELKPS